MPSAGSQGGSGETGAALPVPIPTSPLLLPRGSRGPASAGTLSSPACYLLKGQLMGLPVGDTWPYPEGRVSLTGRPCWPREHLSWEGSGWPALVFHSSPCRPSGSRIPTDVQRPGQSPSSLPTDSVLAILLPQLRLTGGPQSIPSALSDKQEGEGVGVPAPSVNKGPPTVYSVPRFLHFCAFCG